MRPRHKPSLIKMALVSLGGSWRGRVMALAIFCHDAEIETQNRMVLRRLIVATPSKRPSAGFRNW